ncbi:MAG: electron transport complex subunit RsxC [Actinomycetota bacterium]|nr:electron transport complex subunit RsxC [Actinomycetota bacterium]
MKLSTFKGGIHPPYQKEGTAHKPTEEMPLPDMVVIPLLQHVGAPNEPIVKVGDKVEAGQKIGASEAFISAPVHASLSGTVTAIEERKNFAGRSVNSVIIEADPNQPVTWTENRDTDSLDAEQIQQIAKEAGLVGLGGAAFPTYVKLSPPSDKPIDTVILNGCECEPFLTCDHRLMLEKTREVIDGLELMMRAVKASKGILGVEANKMDAIEKLEGLVSSRDDIEVIPLEVKYPQGNEKMLIEAVTGRRVPPGKLPSEVGALVQNIGTTVALYEAAATGKPVIERVITVTGPGIKEPKNLIVKVGTSIDKLIEACGGFSGTPGKVIMGGPMTGFAQQELSSSVAKGTSGVVVLPADIVEELDERQCVGCDKCVEACPMFLMPNMIVKHTKRGQYDKADFYGARDCFECGCCSFVCPSRIPHVAYVRIAKAEIAAAKKK